MNPLMKNTDTSVINTTQVRDAAADGNEYETLSALLSREYGINLQAANQAIAKQKLQKYLDKYNLSSMAQCLQFIGCHRDRLQELGDFIYSQSTHFNRQPEDFRFLVERVQTSGEEMLNKAGRLSIWSLGCSTG